jgi:3'-phosphoadenosine 5'-phosphosulfate sulfotransferase (PAPS reductase)/FAD synthetase
VNPYRIEGPALISFSGGRTSAFMLHEILRAYDGKLPEDVVVAFANTGKEREETLRFVHECGSRWGVKIHWLEYRPKGSDTFPFSSDELRYGGLLRWWLDAAKRCGDAGYEEVGFNSASRSGEPFAALIVKKQFLPNSVMRFCTTELKVRVMNRFLRAELGCDRWVNAIGLRYDEGRRVLKALARNDSNKEPFKAVMPLSKARVTKRDVLAFWAEQPFDLGLKDYEGNCDLCFLKGRGKRLRLIRDNPGMADWWKEQETQALGKTAAAGRFVTEYSYADLEREVATQPFMPGLLDDDEEYDVECGLHCAPMDEEA